MKYRVLRSRSYVNGARCLRTSNHVRGEPESRYRYDGFRIVVRRRKKQ